MSRTYAVELDREHTSVSFDHEFLNVLRSRNLKLDVEQLYSVVKTNVEELYTVGTMRQFFMSMLCLYGRTTTEYNGPNPPKSGGSGSVKRELELIRS